MAKVRRHEGDINISVHRDTWMADTLGDETRALLDEDSRYFLHQSLSTPCLNGVNSCSDVYIEDMEGRRYLDFHGNSVHQVGYGNPAVVAAIKDQLDELNVASDRAIGHYTREKNPVLCAAALATIHYIEEHDLLAHARELGQHALARLHEMQERHKLIGDVRGLGLMLGVELVRDRESKKRATDEAEQIMYAAMRQGLSFKVTRGNVLALMPPLTISREQLDGALDIVEHSIGAVEG